MLVKGLRRPPSLDTSAAWRGWGAVSVTQLTSTFNWWRAMPHRRNTMNPRVWSLCSNEYYGRPIWRLHMG